MHLRWCTLRSPTMAGCMVWSTVNVRKKSDCTSMQSETQVKDFAVAAAGAWASWITTLTWFAATC
jgi:hypothetical protein